MADEGESISFKLRLIIFIAVLNASPPLPPAFRLILCRVLKLILEAQWNETKKSGCFCANYLTPI